MGVWGGSSDSLTKNISSISHGLSAGDVVRPSGTGFVKAQADTSDNAETIGIVSDVIDVDNYTITIHGYISTLTGLSANSLYFLSVDVPGLLTLTEPTSANEVNKPMLWATSSTTGYVLNYRGTIVSEVSSSTSIASDIGSVVFFAMSSAPVEFLKADGSAISRTTYSDLFDKIGTTFGVGDGSTTFNVPDMRGEFPRGFDDGKGTDSSRAFGSSQLDALQKIAYQSEHNLHYGGRGSGIITSLGGGGQKFGKEYCFATTHPDDGSAGSPRQAIETRPRNIALLACIKYI